MKELHEMKEFEFSELLENTKFTSVEEERQNNSKTYLDTGVDSDGDEIRDDILEKERFKENFKKKDSKLHKYLSFATGFAYTIISPVLLLLGIYFALQRVIGFKSNDLVIILLIFLGIVTGYWTLFKDINKITNKKGNKNGK
jgi:hypothetical protein